MKKILLIMILSASTSLLFAQKDKEIIAPPDMPRNEENNQVYYKDVITEDGVDSKELYKRALVWYRHFYKNPTGIVETSDSVTGTLVLKPQAAVFREKDKVKVQSAIVRYTLVIGFKDGKYRYEIKDLNLKAASYVPIEKLFNASDPNLEDNYNTLNEANKYFLALIDDLVASMREPSNKVKTDEW